MKITHELILFIQAVAFVPYTIAFLRLVRPGRVSSICPWIGMGILCDLVLAIVASTSNLGGPSTGTQMRLF